MMRITCCKRLEENSQAEPFRTSRKNLRSDSYIMDCINMHEIDKKKGMAASSKIIHPRIQVWYIGLAAGHK